LRLDHRQGLGFRRLFLGRLDQVDDQRHFHDLRRHSLGGHDDQDDADVGADDDAQQAAARAVVGRERA
jgi:hypothetical protein